jgi:3-oxoacyl-[acyl-carrier protein] reductase/pteridine reductase
MRAWASHAHYCSSKAALHMLTQAMAKAFAPEVRVNCVAPGFIELEDSPRESAAEASHFAARTPLARNGYAKDVAHAVRYLSVYAPFVTGQILAIDGGLGL